MAVKRTLAAVALALAGCQAPPQEPPIKATDPGYIVVSTTPSCLVTKMRDNASQRLIYVAENRVWNRGNTCSIAVQYDGVGPGN